jgi:hypothetical protein
MEKLFTLRPWFALSRTSRLVSLLKAVHCRVQKTAPLLLILSEMDPGHVLISSNLYCYYCILLLFIIIFMVTIEVVHTQI